MALNTTATIDLSMPKVKDEHGKFKALDLPERELVQMNTDGYTFKEIAGYYGCSVGYISKVFKVLGVVPFYSRGGRLKDASIRVPVSEATLAYIAGLLDGEGSVNYRSLYISNTCYEVIEFLEKEVGGVTYERQGRTPEGGPAKPVFLWYLLRAKDMNSFLKAVLPYLIIKRQSVQAILAHLEQKLSR